MTIDFNILNTIEPLPDDFKEKVDEMNIENEIGQIQKEIDSISTDKMPYDKYDYICIFAVAIIEVVTDFITCDPTNPNSLASKFNDSKNPLGKWCNEHIHERINHSNNPLDFKADLTKMANKYLGVDIWAKQYHSVVVTTDN